MDRFTGFPAAIISLAFLFCSCGPTARIGAWHPEARPLIRVVAVAPVVVDSSTVAACPDAERVARDELLAQIHEGKLFELVSTDTLMSLPDGGVASDIDSILASARRLQLDAVVFCKMTGVMGPSYKQDTDWEISFGGSDGVGITPTYKDVYTGQKWYYPIVSIQIIRCLTGEVVAETEFTDGSRFYGESLRTGCSLNAAP